MMIDTLTIARDPRTADLPAGQAEAIAAVIGLSVSEAAAKKADLEPEKHEFKAEIERSRNQLFDLDHERAGRSWRSDRRCREIVG